MPCRFSLDLPLLRVSAAAVMLVIAGSTSLVASEVGDLWGAGDFAITASAQETTDRLATVVFVVSGDQFGQSMDSGLWLLTLDAGTAPAHGIWQATEREIAAAGAVRSGLCDLFGGDGLAASDSESLAGYQAGRAGLGIAITRKVAVAPRVLTQEFKGNSGDVVLAISLGVAPSGDRGLVM